MEKRELSVNGLSLRDAQGEGGDGLTIEGIAVPFGKRFKLWPDVAEVIDPDCDFGTRQVKISREHGELIGKVTKMERSEDGLHITARLSDTASGREVAQLVRDGVMDAFSIGFTPVENRIIESDDGITEVHRRSIDLFETAITGIPAFQDAHITGQRNVKNNPPKKEEPTMNDNQEEIIERMDGFDEQLRDIKAFISRNEGDSHPSAIGSQFRTSGDYLRALANGESEAVELMKQTRDLITTPDTGNTATWIADDLRLLQLRRKVTGILTHDSLPSKGMSMEYNIVVKDESAVSKQASEGEQLKFGKLKFGTKSTDIETFGGWTSLSRQVIDRSTTPMLNTALAALRNAYATSTELAVRTFLYDSIANLRDSAENANKLDAPAAANAMTPDQWAGVIMDAAEEMDDRNASLTRLCVSKDVALSLIALKDSGNRFMDISGKGSDTIGSFDLTGVVGDLMRVPVFVLPKAPENTAAFIDPQAVTVWESGGPTQLTNGDPTKLVDSFSMYGYMAMALTRSEAILPLKFKTA